MKYEYDYIDEDPGTCPDCDEEAQMMRPGKSQPVCECHLKCDECGWKITYHYESGAKETGWWCDNCWNRIPKK